MTSPFAFFDESGTERLTGRARGGGSQTGISVVDYLFTEVATAGVYTAPTLTLPENSYLIDVQWGLVFDSPGNWAADTAVLDVVDSALGTLISAQDVTANVSPGSNPVSAADTVFSSKAYVYDNLNTPEPPGGGTTTTTITTTIAVPPVVPSAVMLVRLIYIAAPTPSQAVFA